jgi:hypothetical protein
MPVLGSGPLRRSAFEHDIDALLVKLALAIDVTETLVDETIVHDGSLAPFAPSAPQAL